MDRYLGWSAVRSTDSIARKEKDQIVLDGTGMGHGIGLCQSGKGNGRGRGELPPNSEPLLSEFNDRHVARRDKFSRAR